MKMARASEADINNLRNAINDGLDLIDSLDKRDGPSTCDIVRDLEGLLKTAEFSSGRVLFGMQVCLENFTDPDKSYLDYSPDLRQAVWLRKKLMPVLRVFEFLGWSPWEEND